MVLPSDFDLGPYLYTVDNNIESFIVYVDDVIQVPDTDYTFSGTGDYPITFAIAPDVGSAITVITGTYWQPMAALEVPGLDPSARFGSSISHYN